MKVLTKAAVVIFSEYMCIKSTLHTLNLYNAICQLNFNTARKTLKDHISLRWASQLPGNPNITAIQLALSILQLLLILPSPTHPVASLHISNEIHTHCHGGQSCKYPPLLLSFILKHNLLSFSHTHLLIVCQTRPLVPVTGSLHHSSRHLDISFLPDLHMAPLCFQIVSLENHSLAPP